MVINGLEKLSLVDLVGKTCATVFLGRCNFLCPFCHNKGLVVDYENQPVITEEELFSFLSTRVGLIDGVCITGGEPTLQKDLKDLIVKIKALGFLVKLDTNGSNPKVLKNLIDEGLIDYVAMDIKNSPCKYPLTVGIDNYDTKNVLTSIEILKSSNIPFEFRTTIVNELHDENDFEKIGKIVQGVDNYYLQKFEDKNGCIAEDWLSAVPIEIAENMKKTLLKYVKNVELRGY